MEFRNKIDEAIKEKGLQKKYVASKVMVTPEHISNWTRNRSAPSVYKALLLAKVLGCKVEDLFEVVEE